MKLKRKDWDRPKKYTLHFAVDPDRGAGAWDFNLRGLSGLRESVVNVFCQNNYSFI